MFGQQKATKTLGSLAWGNQIGTLAKCGHGCIVRSKHSSHQCQSERSALRWMCGYTRATYRRHPSRRALHKPVRRGSGGETQRVNPLTTAAAAAAAARLRGAAVIVRVRRGQLQRARRVRRNGKVTGAEIGGGSGAIVGGSVRLSVRIALAAATARARGRGNRRGREIRGEQLRRRTSLRGGCGW